MILLGFSAIGAYTAHIVVAKSGNDFGYGISARATLGSRTGRLTTCSFSDRPRSIRVGVCVIVAGSEHNNRTAQERDDKQNRCDFFHNFSPFLNKFRRYICYRQTFQTFVVVYFHSFAIIFTI